jgi:hypothetical protein
VYTSDLRIVLASATALAPAICYELDRWSSNSTILFYLPISTSKPARTCLLILPLFEEPYVNIRAIQNSTSNKSFRQATKQRKSNLRTLVLVSAILTFSYFETTPASPFTKRTKPANWNHWIEGGTYWQAAGCQPVFTSRLKQITKPCCSALQAKDN